MLSLHGVIGVITVLLLLCYAMVLLQLVLSYNMVLW